MKKKATASILALLIGGLGIHKFYLRKYTAGILYLLFFWTFIPMILSLIDLIVLILMSDKDFDTKYNNYIERSNF